MYKLSKTIFILLFVLSTKIFAQSADSSINNLLELPTQYINDVEKKVDKYASRITSKTEKTLTKLSRWENKIKTMLEKVNPEAASRLFAPGQMSFSMALEQYQKGQTVVEGYKASYDHYRDELTTQLKYLEEKKSLLENKLVKPLAKTKEKLNELEEDIENTEAAEQFIKERKKELMQQALKYLGENKYLKKIDSECYLYAETLRNYKEIFNSQEKAEQTALALLNKIPAFKKFMRENSMLASMFGGQGNSGAVQSVAGLQTRASVNALIQNQVAAGGAGAQQAIQQNMQMAQAELAKLKDKVLKAGGANSDIEVPDMMPKNMEKAKTFAQRLEYGINFQPVKGTSWMPAGANIGLSIGYKLNGKSVAGVGISYNAGFGSINKIKLSHNGLGLRSFIDWKLKKQLFVTGGFEMNYNATFKNVAQLQVVSAWQQSGLLGISKKISLKTKLMKGSTVQLLYDFLYRQHIPISQPIIFRVGYKL